MNHILQAFFQKSFKTINEIMIEPYAITIDWKTINKESVIERVNDKLNLQAGNYCDATKEKFPLIIAKNVPSFLQ